MTKAAERNTSLPKTAPPRPEENPEATLQRPREQKNQIKINEI